MTRKPQGEISIDDQCRITRADGAVTFEITTGKKTYYLTADSIAVTEDWVKVLQVILLKTSRNLKFRFAICLLFWHLIANVMHNCFQNVQRRNTTKLLLSKEQNKPTLQGWLTKVRNGHAKKCWCVLIGKMFLYFKAPSDSVS